MAVPALAASAWPTLSSSGYCEMIAPFDFPVYRDSTLKTRGTCSPARSYNAYTLSNANPTAFWNSQGYQVK